MKESGKEKERGREKEKGAERDSETGKDKEKDKDKETGKEKEKEKEKDGSKSDSKKAGPGQLPHRIRNTPHLPHSKDAEAVPATLMYWSRAPVWGTLPVHGVRAHSVTLVDTIAWIFGGCDEKGCWRDVFCFNTGTYSS